MLKYFLVLAAVSQLSEIFSKVDFIKKSSSTDGVLIEGASFALPLT
jgi:hypothetical protein